MASTSTSTKAAAPAAELPEYYSFPPFFTLQPVTQTRKYQLRLWRELILRWHQVRRPTTRLAISSLALSPVPWACLSLASPREGRSNTPLGSAPPPLHQTQKHNTRHRRATRRA
jgi:hypothetical protein